MATSDRNQLWQVRKSEAPPLAPFHPSSLWSLEGA